MGRREAFLALTTHPWHKKTYAKLTLPEITWAKQFIDENAKLTVAEFRAKAHYIGLDSANKVRTEVVELLSAANTASEAKAP